LIAFPLRAGAWIGLSGCPPASLDRCTLTSEKRPLETNRSVLRLPMTGRAFAKPGIKKLLSMNRWRILIVEDEFLLTVALTHMLQELGCEVAGTSSTLQAGLDFLDRAAMPDGAVLDCNPAGEKVWPIADILRASGVPFVFSTGRPEIESRFADVPVLIKPYSARALGDALLPLLADRRPQVEQHAVKALARGREYCARDAVTMGRSDTAAPHHSLPRLRDLRFVTVSERLRCGSACRRPHPCQTPVS
jgi:CheY-like chemotaxis protein